MRSSHYLKCSAVMLLWPAQVWCHGDLNVSDPAAAGGHWNFSAAILLPLIISVLLYCIGLYRAWSGRGSGKIISIGSAFSFCAGILALVVALMSPLDAVSEILFSVHMVQHLLLILVAAPLLVMGAPDMALLWALPKGWRSRYGRFCSRIGGALNNESGHSSAPLMVTLLATGVLWIWHVPLLYDLAVNNEAVHYSEHLTFLLTAALFWATVLRLRPRDHAGNGLRILYVFGLALQGSVLGALITMASRPIYQSHNDLPAAWLITPLTDQKLAGVIMWVPPVLLYILVIGFLFYRWLEQSERQRSSISGSGSHQHRHNVIQQR